MAAYNEIPLSSGGAPANAMGLNPGQPLTMGGFDQEINFDPDFQLYVFSVSGRFQSFGMVVATTSANRVVKKRNERTP